MLLKRIIEEGLGAKPTQAERFFEKNKLFNAFRTHSELIERTRFLTFESQLKKLNC